MPSTIDTTPGSPSANSYATVAEGDTYFGDRLGATDWTGNVWSSDEKTRALLQATRDIDSCRWRGARLYRRGWAIIEQALEFPRDLEGRPPGSAASILADAPQIRGGTATSATSTTLVDTDLSDVETYLNDYWNKGSVLIVDGTGQAQIREVSDFVQSTGTLTVAAWSTTPDSTSDYWLIRELDPRIVNACLEQAYYLLQHKGSHAMRDSLKQGLRSTSDGAVAESYGRANLGSLCAIASDLLRPYRRMGVSLGRG